MNDSSSTHIDETSTPTALAERKPHLIGGHRIARATAERPALLISRIGNVLNEIGDGELAAVGLSGRDYVVLAILAVDEPESQHELAELMGKAPGLIVPAIDSLEERELVERVRDRSDRRRSRVVLTAAGKEALNSADQVAARILAEIFAGVESDDRDRLGELLARAVGL